MISVRASRPLDELEAGREGILEIAVGLLHLAGEVQAVIPVGIKEVADLGDHPVVGDPGDRVQPAVDRHAHARGGRDPLGQGRNLVGQACWRG
jgi:hypothetical protein